MDTSFLLLEDGTVFTAAGFGLPAPLMSEQAPCAEVVFNTSMCGYQEILTDPSYHGQMVVMTYPHIGNYGCDPSFEEHLGLPEPISCTALIVRSVYTGPLPSKRVSLQDYLLSHKVVGLSGVDTRALTMHIRNTGAQKAIIFRIKGTSLTNAEYEHALTLVRTYPSVSEQDLIEGVSTKIVCKDPSLSNIQTPKDASLRFAVVDFGIKRSIIAELYRRGVSVTLFPPNTLSKDILQSGCDALLLSNGPGDPERLQEAVSMTKQVIEANLPVFGICLGHQLITWALGGTTKKMKYGHHGGNHPVVDTQTGKCFVTSQNHSYASEESTLPPSATVWFRNANDDSIEGLFCLDKHVCCAQFHPEASPGPHDATWIFDRFIERAKEATL
ncbi:MAG: glutamine-hydrolyzing carbamoyl-phosphate synthase small subunit [Sphaerochaetaceae bacterium]